MKNNSFPQNVEEKHYFMFSQIFLMFGFIEGGWTCILTFALYVLLCYVSHNPGQVHWMRTERQIRFSIVIRTVSICDSPKRSWGRPCVPEPHVESHYFSS